jgi:Outer membrane protein beta-barrel domain
MKKLHLVSVLALSSIISAPAFAANSIEGKAGIGMVQGADNKVGFDAGFAYVIRLERFFAIVPEVNLNWLSYTSSGGTFGGSGVAGSTSTSSNFYTVPVLLNGRFYIPVGSDETPMVQPYVTAGAGYGWSSYVQSNPTATEKLTGFMYQAVVGLKLNLGMISEGSSSSTNIIFELGYRGGSLATPGSVNVNLGGLTARAGVNFAL